MFGFVCKKFPHLRSAARSSVTIYKFYGTKAGDESLNQVKQESLVVSYLVNRCGFAPEKALSASSYIKFKKPDKPDSVLSFLKSHGFSETQVLKVVQRCPPILLCDPHNTLLPKIEFFKSLGFTEEDFTHILCRAPSIFKRSLENQLLPTINFLERFISSPEKIRVCVKRGTWIFSPSCQALMADNVKVLREMGVPESRILHYVHHQPRLITKDKDKFRKILEEVKGLGFVPSRKTFMGAVHVFCSMSKSTWEKKIRIYKKWGLTEAEILETFGKNPWFMSCSEEKILGAMDFLVNKMGFKPSDLMRNPVIITFSLKKRIIPRCLVYQTLAAQGLLLKDLKLLTKMLFVSEEKFLTEFVECYKKDVPELLKLYQLSCLK